MAIPLHERTLARLFRDRAKACADKPFLLYQGRAFSYRQAWETVNRVAGGLIAAGVEPKQHIAILMENRPEAVWLNFALAMIGAVSIPINSAARGDMLAYFLKQSDSVAVVVEEEFIERVAEVLPQCPALKFIALIPSETHPQPSHREFGNIRTIPWQDIATSAPIPDNTYEPAYSDLLHILYSSGTTGPSKGTMIANATAIRSVEKHLEYFGYDSSDVLHTCLPMFHANAINCTILPALMAGATAALSKRFSTSGFWKEINDTGATRTSMLSAMINFLWLKEPSDEERSHRLKTCLVVPTPEFSIDFEKRFNVKISSLYGIGDFGYATMLRPDDPRDKVRSAGRVLPEVALEIFDEDDQPLPRGQTGEICLRSNEPWFGRLGYYNLPAMWVKTIRNLWLHTGDRGWLDEDGYLYFAGRSKELIRRRGENISAIMVEEILRQHPAVADAAVFAVRAEYLEDEVMAAIVFRDGQYLDFREVVEFCVPRMAYFMIPRFLEMMKEFPLTPTGKVEKYKLQESAQPRLGEIWDREKSGIVLNR
jgi:crotonobetaine/carnitine-CoA ligase